MSELRKVTFTRRSDGRWDVLRERAENGERITGCRNLAECFAMVRKVARGVRLLRVELFWGPK